MGRRSGWTWWIALLGLWLLASGADRHWLAGDQRLPAWDQADYLNSAIDHGRALGLLPGGGWSGWQNLLDLSPKIPPLASLVSGTVMAVAGENPDAASWSLSIWNGLLLLVVALWGRQLLSPGFGLLAAGLVALAPALAELRVDFTLEIPLTASVCLALWLLWRWQRPDPDGGRWCQAVAAAIAIAAALLVKQSALLFLSPAAIWSVARASGNHQRRLQGLAGLGLVLVLLLPWLHHNWITTLGGTERAVISSGAQEGDPGSLDPRSLLWYPRLWPQQLGMVSTTIGLSGLLLQAWRRRHHWRRSLGSGWPWVVGCSLSGWIFTSLSPNKDPRYIVPLLPLLCLITARGWWTLGDWLRSRWGATSAGIALTVGLLSAGGSTARQRLQERMAEPVPGVPQAMAALRQQVDQRPTTLLITASEPDFNEHTLTLLGRANGGQILARRLGRSPGQQKLALEQGQWWLLATGNQGTRRASGRALSRLVRSDGRYERVQSWAWDGGRQIELWRRRSTAPEPEPFDRAFIRLARGLQQGPPGLAVVFEVIGPWHLVDPRFSYQRRVASWARERLRQDPGDRDALWSLALLAVLQNRPHQADHWFQHLERADGRGGWPSAYRAVVLLASWNSCAAARAADSGPSTVGADAAPVLEALRDLGRSGCFDPRGLINLPRSLPAAVKEVSEPIKPSVKPPLRTT